MAGFSYRGSTLGSSPRWLVGSIPTPSHSPFLGVTPLAESNPLVVRDQSVLWFDAAETKPPEYKPPSAGNPSDEEEPQPLSEGEEETQEPRKRHVCTAPKLQYRRLLKAGVFGVILAIVLLPMMTAFCSIIFQDAFFEPYFSSLVRHLFLSCAIQQFVMSMKSMLPFATGQVQDIGLYFMMTMASAVVNDKLPEKADQNDKDFVMGGVIFILTFAALFVGILLVLVSMFRLASLVQYVPLPVVGGYLGYLGYFLIISGAFLSADISGEGFKSYPELIELRHEWWHSNLFKVFTGIACFLFIETVVSLFNHPVALPMVLLFIPAVFYAVLFASGTTIDEARETGWLSETPGSDSGNENFIDIWGLINISEIQNYLDLIPKHMRTIVPLFLLVAFGSCLDIAAIQQDYTNEIDFDRELATVGLQNTLAGIACAGYTGSYIFSTTLFAMKNAVDHKLAGFVLAGIEFLVFLLPFSPVSYIPNFYLGGLVIWIGYGIFVDWMIHAHGKVSRSEYVLIWITFLCVLASELTYGLLAGALISMFVFIFSYARSNIAEVRIIPSRKSVVKTVDQRVVLEKFHNNWIAVRLSGYIFFGSSVNIGKKLVKMALDQRQKLMDSLDDCEELVRAAIVESPLILILDMRLVKGLDATAARTIGAVRRSLSAEGVTLFITDLHEEQKDIYKLLEAHKAILHSGDDLELIANGMAGQGDVDCQSGVFFTSADSAVSHCEEVFLNAAIRHGICRSESESLTLTEVLMSHLSSPKVFANAHTDYGTMCAVISNFTKKLAYKAGEHLFQRDDPSNEFFIVKKGRISLEICFNEKRQILEFGPGGIFGETDFYLNRPRFFNAIATENCEVWKVAREEFERMIGAAPNIAIYLQLMVSRCSSLSCVSILQLLERAQNSM